MPRREASALYLDQLLYRTDDFPRSGAALNVVPYIAAKKAQIPSLTGDLLRSVAALEFAAHVDGSSLLDSSLLLENDVDKKRTGWVPQRERGGHGVRSSPRLAKGASRGGSGTRAQDPSGTTPSTPRRGLPRCSGCAELGRLLESAYERLEAAFSRPQSIPSPLPTSKGGKLKPRRFIDAFIQTPQVVGGGGKRRRCANSE